MKLRIRLFSIKTVSIFLLFFFVSVVGLRAQVYKSSNVPVEQRIENLLKLMTLEEKIAQLSGIGTDTKPNKRLGIPGFKMTDGPLGVRNGQATAFPSGVSMGAMWDTVLVHNIAIAMAKETKAKKLNALLGPCVNIHRLPIGGRNFESFGEDPYLSSRLAVNYIKGVQSQKIIACVKHFACNDQEWERMKYDVVVDERALHEIHLPMFKAAVKEAGVWTVMCAYNKINGPYASANKYLLTDVLKKEWGFKGLVMSDWEATHSTVPSALAGLDLEMPTGIYFSDSLLLAVKQKKVSEDVINDKVRRILRVKFTSGMFDPKITKIDTMVLYGKEHKQLALDAARNSLVLLKNENILPLDKTKIKSIAVIGPNAAVARTGGGGSSMVAPMSSVSPLEGIKKRIGKTAKINYALGDQLDIEGMKAIPSKYFVPSNGDANDTGLWGEYFNNIKLEGNPVVTRTDKQLDFNFELKPPAAKVGEDNWSSRWTGMLKPPVTRKYTIYTQSDDGIRVWFNDKQVIDNWDVHGPELDSFVVDMEAGKTYPIKIEYFEGNMGAMVRMGWDLPESGGKENVDRIAEAVNAAKQSEVAIVFAGFSNQYESEGTDPKSGMNLPNKQNELIKAVASANPKTIVVLNNGIAINVSEWLGSVPALLEAWYPGQAGGDAIADVLFGDFNPCGKLPVSYIANEDQSPAMKGYKSPDLKVRYDEGIFVGYRYYDKNNIQPAFPFGFGLSYTQFEYSNLQVSPLPNGTAQISAEITNTGKRAGSEVVQLYIKDAESKLPRPEKELKGFAKIHLAPGAKGKVSFTLTKDDLSFYDPKVKKWILEPGVFNVMVGSSSRDIKLKSNFYSK